MSKFLTVFIFSILYAACIYAQNVEDFELSPPQAKLTGSLYHHFKYLDSRADSTNFGFVQTGFFNRKAKVITKTPLAEQLRQVFNSFADTVGKIGEFVFQLRQLSFAEITGGVSEKGYFAIRAALYANRGGNYQKIQNIDTVLVLSSGIDVTKALLQKGRDTICGFLSTGMLRESAGQFYSWHDLLNLDSLEKSHIKLYNATTYTDGLYLNYKSFMNQMPDGQIILDGGDLNYGTIKTTAANGKLQKVKAQKVYALVYKGQPYISSRGDYYPLKKEKDDFYFTGKVQTANGTAEIVAASVLFGAIGALIATASNTDATFDIKIDHINGQFIKLREFPQPSAFDYHE